VRFEVKLVDFHDRGRGGNRHRQDDLVEVARLLRDMTGGTATYSRRSEAVRHIVCGGRRDLVMRKFPSAAHLRRHLETFEWAAG
jgi:hypothetical protein